MIKDIVDYQKRMGFTYREMVEKIGMPFATYYKLAKGRTKRYNSVTRKKT